MDPLLIVWISMFVVLILIELLTLGLTTIWFAGGALIAMIANVFGANNIVQWVLFFLASIVLLVATRPFAVRFLNKDRVSTNADSLIGQLGIVDQEIDNLKAMGNIMIHGQDWTARSVTSDLVIEKGKTVVIRSIEGVKLIVEEQKAEPKIESKAVQKAE
jgi:membrane protein implicated in regulation of membrane protease activity